MPAHYYLGFDCATKTLAYGLIRLDFDGLAAAIEAPPSAGKNAAIAKAVSSSIALLAGDVVDLFPGRADKTIDVVSRVKALARYVNETVRPAVARETARVPGRFTVVVEFQMGPNAPARAIAAALIALFHDADVKVVPPSLKNKIWFCEEGKYCYFAEKYATNYTANKAHTKFNLEVLEKRFGTKIPKTSLCRGHLADAIIQCFGYIKYGGGAAEL